MDEFARMPLVNMASKNDILKQKDDIIKDKMQKISNLQSQLNAEKSKAESKINSLSDLK